MDKPYDPVERMRSLYVVNAETGCWDWTGYKTDKGYGRVMLKRLHPKRLAAHRVSYELWRGKIPDGLHIDHLCRNPSCINPDHLEPVTQAENTRRGLVGNQVVCQRGHPFSGENLGFHRGYKRCKTCRRANQKKCRRAKKLALLNQQVAEART